MESTLYKQVQSSDSQLSLPGVPTLQLRYNLPRLHKGRTLYVFHEGKPSELIYWTRDRIGPVLAQNISGQWILIHVNLRRLLGELDLGPMLTGQQIADVEQSLEQIAA